MIFIFSIFLKRIYFLKCLYLRVFIKTFNIGDMDITSILLTFLVISIDYANSKKKPKSVTTVIDAKWEVTPLVLEMAEYLFEENPTSFWNFVDAISSLDPPLIDERKCTIII